MDQSNNSPVPPYEYVPVTVTFNVHPILKVSLQLLADQFTGGKVSHLVLASLQYLFEHTRTLPEGLYTPDADLYLKLERTGDPRYVVPPAKFWGESE